MKRPPSSSSVSDSDDDSYDERPLSSKPKGKRRRKHLSCQFLVSFLTSKPGADSTISDADVIRGLRDEIAQLHLLIRTLANSKATEVPNVLKALDALPTPSPSVTPTPPPPHASTTFSPMPLPLPLPVVPSSAMVLPDSPPPSVEGSPPTHSIADLFPSYSIDGPAPTFDHNHVGGTSADALDAFAAVADCWTSVRPGDSSGGWTTEKMFAAYGPQTPGLSAVPTAFFGGGEAVSRTIF
ncbi:hypothetical protein MNV49_003073 [Pseudohyphozyma bogoriensis]|nr:hypothetical protein MNV49_003073 [Pseudohyphozyma bogoriensis]